MPDCIKLPQLSLGEPKQQQQHTAKHGEAQSGPHRPPSLSPVLARARAITSSRARPGGSRAAKRASDRAYMPGGSQGLTGRSTCRWVWHAELRSVSSSGGSGLAGVLVAHGLAFSRAAQAVHCMHAAQSRLLT